MEIKVQYMELVLIAIALLTGCFSGLLIVKILDEGYPRNLERKKRFHQKGFK